MEKWAEQRSYQNLLWIACEKCALTLHSCISVTDNVKINEQKKPIATGPFYVRTEGETIWTLPPEDVEVLNPMGYPTS